MAKSPPPAYRDVLNASRKFAIALLDYFDHIGLTTRVGDCAQTAPALTASHCIVVTPGQRGAELA